MPPSSTLLLAFASAGAFALSFPLSETFVAGWPLTFVWPALLAIAAATAPSWRSVLVSVFPAFYAAFLAHQWWMREITEVGMPILVGYLAAWTTVLALLIRWLAGPRRRQGDADGATGSMPCMLAVPLALVAVEFFRGDVVCSGYAWFFAAHPLVEWPAIAWIASIGGGWLLSAAAGFVGGAIADFVLGPRFMRVVAPGALALLAAIIGLRAMIATPAATSDDAAKARFLLVQTNLPMSNKLGWAPQDQIDDFVDFAKLTLEGVREANGSVDAVVWPETMVPGFGLEPESLRTLVDQGLFPRDRFDEALRDLSSMADAPLIVGSPAFLGLRVEGNRFVWEKQFNSAYLVDKAGKQGRTDKIFLTPFGETMPVISNWDWLEQELLAIGASGMTFDLDVAAAPERFTLETAAGQVRVGVPICFEITAPWASRRIAFDNDGRAADVLVNISNDGWFGYSGAGRRQHLQVAQLRAIELATPVVRAANTGMSASISASGRVLAVLPSNKAGNLVAEVVPAASGRGEPYAVLVGDMVAWGASLSIVLVLVARRRPARQSHAGRRAD
ncbi:MAG: Apolipoprotein N-acyltransferase [Planctomycetota bacterium]